MSAMPFYPMFLNLARVPVLVVGGGAVAVRKVTKLLAAHATVTAVATSFCPEFLALQKRAKKYGGLRLVRQAFRSDYLKNQRIVFAATDDPPLNTRIADICKQRGILVNVAAPSNAGNFHVPAIIRRGQFCIAVSTGGASAHLAQHWRRRLEKQIGPEWSALTAMLAVKRRQVLARTADVALRKQILVALSQPKFAALIRRDSVAAASRTMDRLISRLLLAAAGEQR
ncbi:MAG: bifunctional precorrin-2 dehydrogenase/sirohydrochlorin ferrochelatase [Planctomycetota bacterium]